MSEEAEAGALRWNAAEAFNGAPGLTPLACRLGIAMVCAMDTKTRACFPSEGYLAAKLNVTPRAVRKAKVELREAELINWTNIGGRRHECRYSFNWNLIERYYEEAKARAKGAAEAIRKQRKQELQFRIRKSNISRESNGEESVTRNGVTPWRNGDAAKPELSCKQAELSSSKEEPQFRADRNPSSADTTHYLPTSSAAQWF